MPPGRVDRCCFRSQTKFSLNLRAPLADALIREVEFVFIIQRQTHKLALIVGQRFGRFELITLAGPVAAGLSALDHELAVQIAECVLEPFRVANLVPQPIEGYGLSGQIQLTQLLQVSPCFLPCRLRFAAVPCGDTKNQVLIASRGNDGSTGDIEQMHAVLAQSGADFRARPLGVTGGPAIEKPNRRPAHKASSPVAGIRVLPIPASLMKSPHDTSAARFGHQGSLPANSNWRQAS